MLRDLDRSHLLQLFAHEPLQKIVGGVIALRLCRLHQGIDLRGHLLLLVERKLHGLASGSELRFGCRNRRDHKFATGIHHVLYKPMRVLLLLLALPIEMRTQLGERLCIKMRGNRHILEHRAEFVANLLIHGIDDLLAG